ncbi:MAG: hypothetical protein M8357_00555 [Desulfobulbaceae bacterium]|nr:hypothetical protein [Desulfobulbaceae bacterium]
MEKEQYANERAIIEPDAKRAWEQDISIRTEFNGNFDDYIAFKIAQSKGLIRIQGEKRGGV